MRKTVIAVVALGLVAVGAGLAWYVTRPTVVEVRVLLTEAGRDVTDRATVAVAEVLAESSSEGLSGRIVRRYQPDPDASARYPVEPGKPLLVSVSVPGYGSIEERLTPSRGEIVDREIVLDAALVEVAALGDEDAQLNLQTAPKGENPTVTLLEAGGETLTRFLRPGAYTIAAVARPPDLSMRAAPPRATEEIVVEPGEEIALTLDARSADVVFRFAAPLPLDETMPRATVELVDAGTGEIVRRGYATPEGVFEARNLPLGRYDVSAVFEDPDRGVTTDHVEVDERVEIGVRTEEVELPVSFTRVTITFEGELPQGLRPELVQVIETAGKGVPYASDRLAEGEATGTVVYLPHPMDGEDVTFAASVRGGNLALGLAPIGRPEPGSAVEVTVSPGEGRALCVELYSERSCLDPDA